MAKSKRKLDLITTLRYVRMIKKYQRKVEQLEEENKRLIARIVIADSARFESDFVLQ